MSEEKKWYVLRVISGKEKKVKQNIESEVSRSNWGSYITQVLVPTEKVYQIKNGKKQVKDRNYFPGYLLVEILDQDYEDERKRKEQLKLVQSIVQSISAVNGVINFLGDKGVPVPLRKVEVNRILGKVDEMQESGEVMTEPYLIGETIKIIDGPFNDFFGVIEEINDDRKKLKVIVKIFGRRTPVELSFTQVEKQA
jgi:transcriptional antiterminator NusG